MVRENIKCSHCCNMNFDVKISIVPSAVSLSCSKCGHITPLLLVDKFNKMFEINGSEMMKLYDESFVRDVDCYELRSAQADDIRKNMSDVLK